MEKILLYAILLCATALTAQDWEKVNYGTIGIHYQQVDFAEFNESVKDLGFPVLEESMVDLSGGYTVHNRAWKTYYFFALGLNEASTAANAPETRYQHAGVGFATSYNVLRPGRAVFLGPEFQFLFRGEQMVLADRGQVSNVATAIGTEYTKFTRFGAPLDVGINTHYAAKLSPNKENFIIIALRAGYRLETDTGWQLDQAVDIEETGINSGGLYAGLRIGVRLY